MPEFRRIIPGQISVAGWKNIFIPETEYTASPLNWFTIADVGKLISLRPDAVTGLTDLYLPKTVVFPERTHYGLYLGEANSLIAARMSLYVNNIAQKGNFSIDFVNDSGEKICVSNENVASLTNDDFKSFRFIKRIEGASATLSVFMTLFRQIGIPSFPTEVDGQTVATIAALQNLLKSAGSLSFPDRTIGAGEYEINFSSSNVTTNSNTSIILTRFLDSNNGSNIRSCYIPSHYDISGVQSMFYRCQNLEEIYFEDGVKFPTYNSAKIFEECPSLKKITLPSTLSNSAQILNGLSSSASYTPFLEEITVHPGGRYISDGNCLIDGNTNYLLLAGRNAKIPDYCERIQSIAFRGRIGDGIIEIPESVTNITGNAFTDSSFAGIKFKSTTPPAILTTTFNNTTFPIYVPSDYLELYQNSTNWVNYADRLVGY